MHFMFDSGLTIDEARTIEATNAYIRTNRCPECANQPRLINNEWLMLHRRSCSLDAVAPEGLVL